MSGTASVGGDDDGIEPIGLGDENVAVRPGLDEARHAVRREEEQLPGYRREGAPGQSW